MPPNANSSCLPGAGASSEHHAADISAECDEPADLGFFARLQDEPLGAGGHRLGLDQGAGDTCRAAGNVVASFQLAGDLRFEDVQAMSFQLQLLNFNTSLGNIDLRRRGRAFGSDVHRPGNLPAG